jgi:hypothetical protein
VVSHSASDGGVKKAALSERSEFADFSRRSVKRNERSTHSLDFLVLFHQGKRTSPPLPSGRHTPLLAKNIPPDCFVASRLPMTGMWLSFPFVYPENIPTGNDGKLAF